MNNINSEIIAILIGIVIIVALYVYLDRLNGELKRMRNNLASVGNDFNTNINWVKEKQYLLVAAIWHHMRALDLVKDFTDWCTARYPKHFIQGNIQAEQMLFQLAPGVLLQIFESFPQLDDERVKDLRYELQCAMVDCEKIYLKQHEMVAEFNEKLATFPYNLSGGLLGTIKPAEPVSPPDWNHSPDDRTSENPSVNQNLLVQSSI